jgi:FtsP/CotA-like multicopper oxidase with cupredoxin domain
MEPDVRDAVHAPSGPGSRPARRSHRRPRPAGRSSPRRRTGDSFTFESSFKDLAGRTVDHCHVLSHEDLGMMEALEIVP